MLTLFFLFDSTEYKGQIQSRTDISSIWLLQCIQVGHRLCIMKLGVIMLIMYPEVKLTNICLASFKLSGFYFTLFYYMAVKESGDYIYGI